MCKENTVGYIPTLKDRVTAALLRFFNPGYSYCSKCGKPWNHCKPKAIRTSPTRGTFATCQKCWDNSTLDQLKVYYTGTYQLQELLKVVTAFDDMRPGSKEMFQVLLDYVKEKETTPKAS